MRKFATIGALGLLALNASSYGAPGDTELVSERFDAPAPSITGNFYSQTISTGGRAVSGDGRYVAFVSAAADLVPSDNNNRIDVFVYDRVTTSVELVSLDSAGNQGNSDSYSPSISDDGRYVAFRSFATNLVAGDTNNRWDIFVHDRTTNTTERVSVDSAGIQANNDSYDASISGDGRYVAFRSFASNLVTGDTNGHWDIFVHDRTTNTTERVSVDSAGTQGNGFSYYPSITEDGRYVTFSSWATNLVAGDTNNAYDVFVRDRVTNTTERVSVDSAGVQGNSSSYDPSISDDGRYVAFRSAASNLVTGDTNNQQDIFVHDRTTNTTERVSVDNAGTQGNGFSGESSISDDGRYVAFRSQATNLVAGDTNFQADVFVRDRTANTTERISIGNSGNQGNSTSYSPSISDNGQVVAFDSYATNLVDDDENQSRDVFVFDRSANNIEIASRSFEVLSLYGGDSFSDIWNSGRSAVDSSGRYVAFYSQSTNLVAADTNNRRDVFLRDRATNTTELISVAITGGVGNSESFHPTISADGRYVAFWSHATNLVTGDTNGRSDVFVRDRDSGTTELVSVDSAGNQGNSTSYYPSISADGRYVAFYSHATNLVANDTNGRLDVFVKDRQTGVTERVSVDSTGTQGNYQSYYPTISADGRYVAFWSYASNLVTSDTNGTRADVFVHDRDTGITELVSVDSAGNQGNNTSYYPSISADGRYVAFHSIASNLVTNDNNGGWDIFVHDRDTGTTERVSVDSAGNQGAGSSYYASISDDGRYVAFYSTATNLVAGDTNNAPDIFVHDRDTGTTVVASVSSAGVLGNYSSYHANISGDGSAVAFRSSATNLAPDGNRAADVFIHQLGANANSAPVADDQAVSTDEESALAITLTATDPDGDPLTFTVTGGPTNGTLSGTAPNLTYTPGPDFNGSDSFTFEANDGALDSNVATVSITVDPVNDAPAANDDMDSTNEDTAVMTSVLDNDTDIDVGDVLVVSGNTQGSNGSVSCTASACTYTPSLDFNGTDSYTYTVSDGNGGTDTATVDITIIAVNDAPVANDDTDSTNEDTAVTTDVLDNDSDVDVGDTLVVSGNTQGSNGSVSCGMSSCTYTPSLDFNGTDSYSYTVSDGNGGTDTATVDITIVAVNDAPEADAGGPYGGNEGASIGLDGSGSSDVDGDSLTYAWSVNSSACSFDDSASVSPLLTCADNGSFTVTLTVTDPSGETDSATASVSVVNVAPTIAADAASITVNESATATNNGSFADVGGDDVAVSASAGSISQSDPKDGTWSWSLNSTDGPDESQTVTITATDSDGAVSTTTFALTVNNVAPTVAADAASVTVNEGDTANNTGSFADVGDDVVTITASGGSVSQTGAQNGTWSWSFGTTDGPDDSQTVTITATDSDGASTSTTFALTVNNVAPTVDAGADASLTEGDTFTRTGSFADPGADTWTATVDYGEGAGSEMLALSGNVFNLSNLYEDDGVYTVSVTVTDSDGASTTDTVIVEVVNAPPTVAADGASVTVNEADTASNTGTFGDVGDDTVTITASAGTVTQAGTQNGTWSWSFGTTDGPDDGQTVTITATDSDGASTSTTFGLTVNNVAPTVAADAASVTVNEGDTAGNSGSFADAGDDIVTISASAGLVSQAGTQNGTWSWTFNSMDGPDDGQTVTITATDSDGASTSTMFTLTVLNVPPVADDDAYTMAEDTDLIVAAPGVLDGDTDVGLDSLSATVATGPSNGTLSLALNGGFTYTPNLNFNGTDSFTYVVTDDDGASDIGEVTITVTPVNDAPSVSANDDTAQYSDPVLVTISAGDIDSTSLTIGTTALPAGLSLSGPTCPDIGTAPPVNCTWTVSGDVTAAPGTYPVTATVTDNGELSDTTPKSTSKTFVITVEQEDARSTYTGPLFLSSAENGDFTVTLMATIRDITAVDPAQDPDAGVITNASVSFWDRSDPDPANWALLCNAPAVTLVFAGDEQVGSASCDYSDSLDNNEDELPLDVSIVVNDHYVNGTEDDSEVVVLIVRPGEGRITGGGQLELANSAGVYTANPDMPTNYGFNAMAQKKGKKNVQLKGRMTIILRATDGRKYKIRSNALLSLGTDLDPDGDGNSEDEPFYAEFEAKANLTDVTDPLNPISLGGNLLLQMRMTDNGEPGENDTISLTLWDGGTLLFSSNWDGSQSVEQQVARGNLQVHP